MFGTSIKFDADADDDINQKISRMSSIKDTKGELLDEDMPNFMFHPNRTPKTVWNLIMVVLLIYTATVMPYKISFIDSVPGDGWYYLDI